MPNINIYETDNTTYGYNTVNNNNIVFIPGLAVTGPYDAPVLCTSYKQFVNTFGSYGVEQDLQEGSSWDYATEMIEAGFPVLFKRIIPESAMAVATAEVAGSAGSITVKAKYPGSYGSKLGFFISYNDNNKLLACKVYYKDSNRYTLVESVKIGYIIPEDGVNQNTAITNALKGISSKAFTSVEVSVSEDYAYQVMDEVKMLAGGSDGSVADCIEILRKEVITDSIDGETAVDLPGNSVESLAYASPYSFITDKYETDVKFITSGGIVDQNSYTSIAERIGQICNFRKDCIGIPDIYEDCEKANVHEAFNSLGVGETYCAAYAPWAYVKLSNGETKLMSPSFIFLQTLAKSISKGNYIWKAPAGVQRMIVENLVEPMYEVSGSLMKKWQNSDTQAINPIMKLRNYGYCIYGNRTLYTPTSTTSSALQQLSVRLATIEIKKKIFDISCKLTFENNIQYTWDEFRSELSDLLVTMKSTFGIYDYQIIFDGTTTSQDNVNNRTAVGRVRISIMNTIENFDIGFELLPQGVNFSE